PLVMEDLADPQVAWVVIENGTAYRFAHNGTKFVPHMYFPGKLEKSGSHYKLSYAEGEVWTFSLEGPSTTAYRTWFAHTQKTLGNLVTYERDGQHRLTKITQRVEDAGESVTTIVWDDDPRYTWSESHDLHRPIRINMWM